ncbi:hypothetical protein B0H14DRAFT_2563325 [Mycena olivaceomarginata]|nr:hypothetical protein B0H14DRAFT_2563325 [Mycena olivaceomarginata]
MAVLIWLGSLAKGGGGGPDMVAHLQTFLAPVKDRLQILNEYKSGALTITMTCQNVQCTKECLKHEIKSCSGCSTAQYCSRDCKTADWRLGHRQMCESLRWSRNSTFAVFNCAIAEGDVADYARINTRWMSINTGDKSFLRVLCAYEYNTRQEDIALEHLVFIRKYPDAAPCMVSVRALDELEFDFPYDTARAKAGDGRMALHVMKTGFIPGLKAIADTIPDSKNLDSDGLEEYRSVVRDLFKAGAQADSQTPLVVMVLPMAGLTSNNNM